MEWEKEGLHRVRARLASILRRWGVADITATQVEDDILAAHKKAAKELGGRNPREAILEERKAR